MEEAFFDLDFAWTLACRFFSSERANFRPQLSQENGFSPENSQCHSQSQSVRTLHKRVVEVDMKFLSVFTCYVCIYTYVFILHYLCVSGCGW